jgi:hypothetical protein
MKLMAIKKERQSIQSGQITRYDDKKPNSKSRCFCKYRIIAQSLARLTSMICLNHNPLDQTGLLFG